MHLLPLFKAVIMGIVEGVTEFLPISSTGHMVLVGNFIGFGDSFTKEYVDMFEIVIQLGAILAIVVLFWAKIKRSLVEFEDYGLKLWTSLIIAFLPAAVLGVLLKKRVIDKYLMNPETVIIALIVGAVLMLYMEKRFRKNAKTKNIEDVNIKQSVKIGLFQCLSLWPGMSRSASTIMGGWFSGLDNVAASEFSFFLALPTMVAASGYSLLGAMKKGDVHFGSNEISALIIGFIVAFVVALVVVERFIAFLKRKPMRVFAIYRLLLGAILLILAFSKVITLTMY